MADPTGTDKGQKRLHRDDGLKGLVDSSPRHAMHLKSLGKQKSLVLNLSQAHVML